MSGGGGGSSPLAEASADLNQVSADQVAGIQTGQTSYNNSVNQAINQQNISANNSIADENGALQYVTNLAQPYTLAGGNALDALMQSYGLATPQGGSAALNANNVANVNNYINGATNTNAANTTANSATNTPGLSNLTALNSTPNMTQGTAAQNMQGFLNSPLAAANLGSSYNANNSAYQNFVNSQQAQSLYGTIDPNATATQNFENSPYAAQNLANMIQKGNQSAAAGGTLNSPQTAAYLQSQAANQFTNWQNGISSAYNTYDTNLNNMFGQYQQGLAGIANTGLSETSNLQSLGNSIYSNQSQINQNLGSQISNLYNQQGTNNANFAMDIGQSKGAAAAAQAQLALMQMPTVGGSSSGLAAGAMGTAPQLADSPAGYAQPLTIGGSTDSQNAAILSDPSSYVSLTGSGASSNGTDVSSGEGSDDMGGSSGSLF